MTNAERPLPATLHDQADALTEKVEATIEGFRGKVLVTANGYFKVLNPELREELRKMLRDALEDMR